MASQQQVNSSSAGPSNMQEEFTVRIPRDKRKAFTMMKFGTSSSLDFAKMGEQPVKLERENNLKEYKTANDIDLLPKFGAGSEYGRELKEESRRKKYGIMLKRYNPEDQPWILKLGAGKQGKRYKGVREGTIAENTSYYIFTKAADGAFEAFPVGEWYNFTPVIKYKYLNSEEAEEEFTRRDKTLNFFNIMLKKRLRKEDDKDLDDDDDEEGGKRKKGKKSKAKSKNMILTDMDEWHDLDMSDDDDDDDDEDNETNGTNKKKNTKTKRKQKATKNSKKNSDDEAIEESDEGDYDDREVDYISDSGSSDSLSGPEVIEKDKNQEKGVDEEKGLRNILDSDAEDEDEEEEEKEEVEEEIEEKEEKKEEKTKKADDSSSSSSDDDSDIEKNMASAIFMQREKSEKKDATEAESSNAGETSGPVPEKKDKGLKRKGEKNSDKAAPSKKHKSDDSEGISEDAIRRYLTRKPMTTKDLLQKFRSKKLNMNNDKITHTIAQLLKKINPDKTTVNKKLYLSLKKPE